MELSDLRNTLTPFARSPSKAVNGDPRSLPFVNYMAQEFADEAVKSSAKSSKKIKPSRYRSWAKPKKCGECGDSRGMTLHGIDDWIMHRVVYHRNGLNVMHNCEICGKTFNEKRWLNKHLRQSHFRFECVMGLDECDARFCSAQLLSQHLESAHGMSQMEAFQRVKEEYEKESSLITQLTNPKIKKQPKKEEKKKKHIYLSSDLPPMITPFLGSNLKKESAIDNMKKSESVKAVIKSKPIKIKVKLKKKKKRKLSEMKLSDE